MGNTVIFDFDGTIVDSAPAILASLEQVLANNDLQPRRPLNRDLIGPPLGTTLTTLTGITDNSDLEKLIAGFKELYDGSGLESTILYGGMDVLIRELAQSGYRLMLATNKRQYPTERLLAKFGLAAYFCGIHCLDTRSPPYLDKASMLTALLQNESLTPQQSIYIGDTCHDELAAARAGLPFIAVAWGYGSGVQLVSARAQMVSTPAALQTAIARYFGN